MKDKLAAWLSILLDSSVLAVSIFIGSAWVDTGALLPALAWAALALLFADGVPLTYIALGRRFGWVSGFDLPRREERAPFIAVNLIGNLLGFFLLRALNVYGMGALSRWRGSGLPSSWQHVIVWGGLRGSVPVALALGLPLTLAGRDNLVAIVFGVVLFSLLGQGLTIPSLRRRLGLVRQETGARVVPQQEK